MKTTYTKEYAEKMIKQCNEYLETHTRANKKGTYYGMDTLAIKANWENYISNNLNNA